MADTLAWHETLEIHELVAFQSNALMSLKKAVKKVEDTKLKALYVDSIKALEGNLKDLLPFYNRAPSNRSEESESNEDAFYAGNLLGMSKNSIKNYANAISETATPALRKVLTKHLNGAIDWHTKIFNYMHDNGLYPAYDLNKLLQNDVNTATKALRMPQQ